MKRIISVSILTLLTTAPFSLYAEAAVCQFVSGGYQMGSGTFFGPTICSAGKLEELSVNGPLTLHGTEIKTLTINGPLTMNQATIQDLTINGVLKATQSHIRTITVNGTLHLLDSQVNNINVPKTPLTGKYEIYLEGTTLVNSNIIFRKGEGVVYQSKEATVKGSIKGAIVRPLKD